jgi:penicillin amidase
LEALNKALSKLTETDPGSNAWAVAGDRCQSGLPLIAGDSHRALDTPNVYYQVHLSCPQFNVIGSSVPGMPGALHFCHNDHVGWGMTYGSADTQDLFIERFRDTTNERVYLFKGEWLPAQLRRETIRVRGAAPIDLEVTRTHHGPVIVGDPAQGHGVAIADPGLLQGTPWLDAARDAMHATSVATLHHALRNWTDRVNNYAVADTQGHFGYLHAGKIPIRPQANGWAAVPGWTGAHEWAGYIPHDELPCAIDPDVGYAVTCNQRVTDHNYPYYVGLYFSADFRARRVRSRLLELTPGQATPEAMGQIHSDRLSYPAQILTRALAHIKSATPRTAQALKILTAWDSCMDRDAVGPTLYACLRRHTVHRVADHLFGSLAPELLTHSAGADTHLRLIAVEITLAIENNDTTLLPPVYSDWPTLLVDALDEALTWLENHLDNDMDRWQWGRLHKTQPRHPLSSIFPTAAPLLDPPSVPVHGDGDTPLAGSYTHDTPFTVTGLSVNRYIHDPAAWERSRWIVPLGSSGHPGSPHYADQAQHWADVEFIPQLWKWDQIRALAQTRQQLCPTP